MYVSLVLIFLIELILYRIPFLARAPENKQLKSLEMSR